MKRSTSARQYSVSVIILSGQAIATRIEAFPEPDLEKVCQSIGPDLSPVPDHKPLRFERGERHHTARRTGDTIDQSGKYPVVTGFGAMMNSGIRPGRRSCTCKWCPNGAKAQTLGGFASHAASLRPAGRQNSSGWLGFNPGTQFARRVDRARAAGDSVRRFTSSISIPFRPDSRISLPGSNPSSSSR